MSWTEWTDNDLPGVDLRNLKVDQAYLDITNAAEKPFYLYWRSDECVDCPFKKLLHIFAAESADKVNHSLIHIDVSRNLDLWMSKTDKGKYLFPNGQDPDINHSSRPDFGQFGVYNLTIAASEAVTLKTVKEPVNIYTSLIFVALILIAFYWLCKSISRIYLSSDDSTQQANEADAEQAKIKKRMRAIDIFRGVAIVLMIFVNSGGGHYWWINHATWNGLHFADVVFPFFLFIMGVCIPMSIKSQMNRQVPTSEIIKRIIKRSIILFLIGLFINTAWGATFETIRIPGVLQRFGVAYFVVSFLHIAFYTNVMSAETRFEQIFVDLRMLRRQWIVIFFIIMLYLLMVFTFDEPGCGRGYLGPGGIANMMRYQNCTGGLAGFVDREFFGVNHLYQGARIRHVYDALVFDPEGIFGCLTTFIQVFLGVQCGTTLLAYPTPVERIQRWCIWGGLLMAITFVLTYFSLDGGIIPINKNLWSLSFVTTTASLAFFLFSLIYYMADVRKIGDDFWTIFLYPGMNAIILYVGHEVLHSIWPFHFKFDVMNTHFILLLENCYTTVIWILISHYLYQNKIFYSV